MYSAIFFEGLLPDVWRVMLSILIFGFAVMSIFFFSIHLAFENFTLITMALWSLDILSLCVFTLVTYFRWSFLIRRWSNWYYSFVAGWIQVSHLLLESKKVEAALSCCWLSIPMMSSPLVLCLRFHGDQEDRLRDDFHHCWKICLMISCWLRHLGLHL